MLQDKSSLTGQQRIRRTRLRGKSTPKGLSYFIVEWHAQAGRDIGALAGGTVLATKINFKLWNGKSFLVPQQVSKIKTAIFKQNKRRQIDYFYFRLRCFWCCVSKFCNLGLSFPPLLLLLMFPL